MERIGVAPGTEIGGYRVVSSLGQGGMGAVYRAVDGGGAPVALKLLHPHLGADPEARERLRREVAHLQRVRHPGVARVLDAEIESSEAFVVTELVDGPDLAAHVRRHGPMPDAELADLADQLREALTEVHGAGVLHRDLTPGNVLISPRGAVLIDFGIAQAAEDPRVTSVGMVVGTPGYLSPELLEGGEPGEAADWWGWAAVLAFAATGRPPFGHRPVQSVLARAREGRPDLEGVPPRTQATLRAALAGAPSARL
ncbi:serine/threonine-protein kinase, partial [Actinotalea sp. C106]|uniref:serine/threonine-protein kinase n=1 Tax=Actinotalea sp. C106 TaxID=2908644 RepID=UPI00202859DE